MLIAASILIPALTGAAGYWLAATIHNSRVLGAVHAAVFALATWICVYIHGTL